MYKLNARGRCPETDKRYKELNQKYLAKLEADGWTIDSFGHAKKEIDGKIYRYKFQATGMRYEVQATVEATQYSAASNMWVRLRTYRYKV